jgi:transcriptional regulator GlxA family with amidase domain
MRPHHVVIVAYEDAELLDVAGPSSVFTGATWLAAQAAGGRGPGYRVTLAGRARGLVRTAGGVRVETTAALADLKPIDTLIVPGSIAVALGPVDPALVRGVRRAAKRSARVASVCGGAFVLAAAGLLEGKRVATHWAGCGALRARYPGTTVEDDAIFVRDGQLWTSAGVTAGIDLALALVEEDQGRELALAAARWLVVYLRRPGGQSQFSVPLASEAAETEPLRELLAWMNEHPAADLRVPLLAQRAGMSERNFTRVFRRELGVTPAAHVAALRLEAARRALETTARPQKRIAKDAGFGTVETMHRVFRRALRVTPRAYRERFATRKATAR